MNRRARIRPTFVGRYNWPHIHGGEGEKRTSPRKRGSDRDKMAHKP